MILYSFIHKLFLMLASTKRHNLSFKMGGNILFLAVLVLVCWLNLKVKPNHQMEILYAYSPQSEAHCLKTQSH
ncbi:hypothetical protein A9306_04370 [Moraxella atlantae]|uniref:Uncharacterized protein n=1 Tax=Faucicola atlantae TaxID=34059 RepID=A0A1B8QK38_9GAMM|nr:hypothetical protein A9306_04370 [Moraxella atlantae]